MPRTWLSIEQDLPRLPLTGQRLLFAQPVRLGQALWPGGPHHNKDDDLLIERRQNHERRNPFDGWQE